MAVEVFLLGFAGLLGWGCGGVGGVGGGCGVGVGVVYYCYDAYAAGLFQPGSTNWALKAAFSNIIP